MTSNVQSVSTSIKRVFLMVFMLGIAATAAAFRQLAAAGILPIDMQGDGMLWLLVGEFDFLVVSGLMLIAFAVASMICTRRLPLAAVCGTIGIALLAAGFLNKVPCDGTSRLGVASCILSGTPFEQGSNAAPVDLSSFDEGERGRRVVAVIAFLAGCACMVLAFNGWRKARPSLAWPTTRGQMIASNIVVYGRIAGKGPRWSFYFGYRYVVDGQQYIGRSIYFGAKPSLGLARSIVPRFPVGAQVAVYHHPSDHATSVLMPGPNRYTYANFLAGPIFGLFAILLWVGRLDG